MLHAVPQASLRYRGIKMYRVNGSNPLLDNLLTEKDRCCFNLFYRIREDAGAFIATDGSTCILAQSNPHTPVWIWLKNSPDEKSRVEISSILRERFSACGRIAVNAYEPYTEALLRSFANSEHAEYRINKRLNVYACPSVHPVQNAEECCRLRPVIRKKSHSLSLL